MISIQEKSYFMKKQILRVLFFALFLCISCVLNITVQAAEDNVENIDKYSDSYQDWLKLSDEERQKVPEPNKYLPRFESSSDLFLNTEQFSPVLKTEVLPSKYDLRNVDGKSYVSAVKSQGNLGLCWAYAALSVLETNAMLHGLIIEGLDPIHNTYAISKSFSDGINLYGIFNELNHGGNYQDALDYWISGLGPVLDSSFDGNGKIQLPASEVLIDTAGIKVNESYELPYLNVNTSNATTIGNYINLLKKEIMNNGAIYFGGAAPMSVSETLSNDYKCGNPYDSTHYSVYTDNHNDLVCAPHAMVIVGWDDSFSKENFKAGLTTKTKPSRDGAWIVKNSWGTSSGDDGYYYYSYEDYNLNREGKWVVSETSIKDFDNIYQYGPITTYAPLGLVGVANGSSDTSAVIFDKAEGVEILDEISFRIQQDYISTIPHIGYDIYVNAVDGNFESDNLKLVQSATKEFNYSGYYTVKLTNPIKLTGEQFAIKIKFKNAKPILSFNGEGIPGQEYLLTSTGWVDVAKNSKSLQIKAFTDDSMSSSEIKSDTFIKYKTDVTDETLENQTAIVKTITNNISSAETLTYFVKDVLGNDVTNSFSIEPGFIINDSSVSNLSFSKYMTSGDYKLETIYNNKILDTTTLEIPLIAKLSDLKYKSFYEGNKGILNFTAYGIEENSFKITIKNAEAVDVTQFFTIRHSNIVNETSNFTIETSPSIPAGKYTIEFLDIDDNIIRERTFSVFSNDKVIELSEIESLESFFNIGYTGRFNFGISTNNIYEDYLKLKIKNKNGELITDKLVVTSSELGSVNPLGNGELSVPLDGIGKSNIEFSYSSDDVLPEGIYTILVSDVDDIVTEQIYFSVKKIGVNLGISDFTTSPEQLNSGTISRIQLTVDTEGFIDDYFKLIIKNDSSQAITNNFSVTASEFDSSINAEKDTVKIKINDSGKTKIDIGSFTPLDSGEYILWITDEKESCFAIKKFTVDDVWLRLKDTSSYKVTDDGENKYIENIILSHGPDGIKTLSRDEFVSQFESFGAEIYEQDGITKVEGVTTVIETGMIVRNSNEDYRIIIKGDVNGDGKITSSDALRIRRHIVGIGTLKNIFIRAGDVDKNGLTSADALKIRRYIIGIGEI